MVEFGTGLEFTYVMGGLLRDYTQGGVPDGIVVAWLNRAESTRMPIDPRLWTEGPIRSTYPACIAVKAAAEQGRDAAERYLRTVREGLMCFRRKVDAKEALVEEARGAGLDVERFRIDLESNAILESFGNDLAETREIPDVARERGCVAESDGGERIALPSYRFGDGDWVFGLASYEELRGGALAAGAEPAGEPPPDPLAALRRFGRMATVEVEAVCGLPGPRAAAELWRLASEWQVKPVRALTGDLWELA